MMIRNRVRLLVLFDRELVEFLMAEAPRPYRMKLPAALRWVEVDLPEILDYKEGVLADAQPTCALERVRLDLSNADARRGLFERLGGSAERAAVLTEGLLIYLMRDEAA